MCIHKGENENKTHSCIVIINTKVLNCRSVRKIFLNKAINELPAIKMFYFIYMTSSILNWR